MKFYEKILITFFITTINAGSVYFSFDTNRIDFPSIEYDTVVVNGSWDNWLGSSIVLNDSDGDGIYIGFIDLANGSYEYVFALTGESDNYSGWGQTLYAPANSLCDFNPNDEFYNYGFTMNEEDVNQAYCAQSCDNFCNDESLDDDYILIWNDEFNGDQLDLNKWNYQLGTGSEYGLWGWGNGESQYYKAENSFIENGVLVIEAKLENFINSNYTSSRINTKNKGDWLYGKFVARMKLPSAGGTWPAFWMLPTNSPYGSWPNSGEIDIMEHFGCDGMYGGNPFSTVHNNIFNWNGGIPPTSYSNNVNNENNEFLNYELLWTEESLNFFIDGVNVGTYSKDDSGWEQWPFDQHFHIILNLAVGSSYMACGTEDDLFPQRFEIDYVRVYQKINCTVGDFNNDNNLDVLDVVGIVDLIIEDGDTYNKCYDLNEDNQLNVIDIVILVERIINNF